MKNTAVTGKKFHINYKKLTLLVLSHTHILLSVTANSKFRTPYNSCVPFSHIPQGMSILP